MRSMTTSADVVNSFNTVDRNILGGVLSGLGLAVGELAS